MITAKEAKDIAISSDSVLDRELEKIEQGIKAEAAKGKQRLLAYDHTTWDSVPAGTPVQPTTLQSRIITKLREQGFGAAIVADATYVPAALQEDDGTGPAHTNHVLYVTWR